MNIIIVGAGASGLLLSIALKEKNLNNHVLVIDHNKKIAKKVYATGNGKCNLANAVINDNSYNNEVVYGILEHYPLNSILKFYESNGIITIQEDNLIYPHNLSSDTTISILVKKALSLGIIFKLEEDILDYDSNILFTNNNQYKYDRLIFATGGQSSPKLGSNGSLFPLFKKHGYLIKELKPGLAPIKCKANNKSIAGLRVAAEVTLTSDKYQYSECGEVLFKEDGLSGIVIFNISSIIARNNFKNVIIHLDLFKDLKLETLIKEFTNVNESKLDFLDGYFHHNLASYLLNILSLKHQDYYQEKDIIRIAKLCKDLSFVYINNYSFEFSQVSIGGISLSNVDKTLQSKIENNVYFIGEVLDVDGLCGGYNLMWACASALLVKDSL